MQEQSDDFWNVRSHEAAEEARYEQSIESLNKAVELGRRATQIRSAPGFDGFVAAVKDLRETALRNLAKDTRLTDAGIREQRGRVQALDDVIALLTRQHLVEELAKRSDELQTSLKEVRARRPAAKVGDVS